METSRHKFTTSKPGGDNEKMKSAQHQSITIQGPVLRFRYPERSRGVSREHQWATHKPMIKKLYVDEGRTLHDVMEIMKKDFGFDVS